MSSSVATPVRFQRAIAPEAKAFLRENLPKYNTAEMMDRWREFREQNKGDPWIDRDEYYSYGKVLIYQYQEDGPYVLSLLEERRESLWDDDDFQDVLDYDLPAAREEIVAEELEEQAEEERVPEVAEVIRAHAHVRRATAAAIRSRKISRREVAELLREAAAFQREPIPRAFLTYTPRGTSDDEGWY